MITREDINRAFEVGIACFPRCQLTPALMQIIEQLLKERDAYKEMVIKK